MNWLKRLLICSWLGHDFSGGPVDDEGDLAEYLEVGEEPNCSRCLALNLEPGVVLFERLPGGLPFDPYWF
jgi:hypothetical protein